MEHKRTSIKALGMTALLMASVLFSVCAGQSKEAEAATAAQANRWIQAATSANKVVTDGFPRKGTVTSYSLNVRKKAGTDSDIVEVLYKNATVEIQEVTKTNAGNYWYKITFVQNGKNISGYVSSAYIKAGASLIAPTPTPLPPEEIIVHEDAVISIPRIHKECPEGEREERIGYSEAFCITEDGTIYLLDTYGKRIWKEKGKDSGYIPIAESVLPADMMYKNGEFYVYDEMEQEFEIYGEDGTLLFVAPIELKDDYVKGFQNLQDHVVLATYGGDAIFPIRELGMVYVMEDMVVQKTVTGDWSFSEYIDADAKGNTYFSYTRLLENSSVLAGEIFIGKWNKDSALVKQIALPMTELRYLPKRWVQIMEDGTIYLFLPLEKSFEIRAIKEEKAYLSSADEITKAVALIEKEYNTIAKSAKKQQVLLSREECLKRALSIVEYKWTLRKQNTEMYNEKKITLPRYIAAIAKKHEGEAAWTEEMVGIPYCWGGFESQYNTQAAQRFDTQLAKNYTAGNINTSYYTTEKSAGLDCSGYAGTVYGMKEKVNTRMLMGVGTAVTSPEKLDSMDMLLYPGEHVILYYGKITDGVLLVTEVAVRDGRTSVHPKRINELIVQPGYQMRKVW